MPRQERFTLRSETIGCLPIVNRFLERMGLSERLDRYLPRDDARLRLAPAAVIGVVVRNIVVRHRPVYALSEWVTPYDPAVLGLEDGDAAALSDDRTGRMLDRLFDSDRASLITETVLAVIRDFDVAVSQLHNDSTTVTLTGACAQADGRSRGGKATAAIVHGHNKDHRPDLEAAAVGPYRLGGRGGAGRLPGGGRQHPRRPHARPNLG
jgi:transposase